jgi:hypothetical protein
VFNENVFGNQCTSNNSGTSCERNVFGNNCDSNTLGLNFRYNIFGNDCSTNTFGNGSFYNSFSNLVRNKNFVSVFVQRMSILIPTDTSQTFINQATIGDYVYDMKSPDDFSIWANKIDNTGAVTTIKLE